MTTRAAQAPRPDSPGSPAVPAEPAGPVHPTRRRVLRAGAGGVGLLSALGVGGLSAVGGLTSRAGLTTTSAELALAAATGCATLTPELTQGPFWVDERLQRRDIRPDSETGAVQSGIPLTLTVRLTDAGASCTPQPGAYVDLWHANAQGAYSDVSGSGNPDYRGVDWLRGYQVSDADGAVTFTTIFPGWYAGRTMHLHFRVRLSLSSSTTLNFTSQLFFDESTSAAVASSPGYTKSGTRTTNSTDNLYDSSMVVPLTGSTSQGYTGAFTVNLDFEDGTGSTGSGSTSASSGTVDASVSGVRVARRRGRWVVLADLTARERVSARVRVVRDHDLLASRTTGWRRAGSHRITVPLPRGTDAGRARVVVQLADRAGSTRIVRRTVRIPS